MAPALRQMGTQKRTSVTCTVCAHRSRTRIVYVVCIAAGDLQLRPYRDAARAASHSFSQPEPPRLEAARNGLAEIGRTPQAAAQPLQQRPDGSSRPRTASAASRFAAEVAAAQEAGRHSSDAAQQRLPNSASGDTSLPHPAAEAPAASPFAAAGLQAPRQPPAQETHGSEGSSSSEADSKAWRQLVEASMHEQRHQLQVTHPCTTSGGSCLSILTYTAKFA